MYSVPMFPWQHMSVWAVTPVGTGVILVCVCVCTLVHTWVCLGKCGPPTPSPHGVAIGRKGMSA